MKRLTLFKKQIMNTIKIRRIIIGGIAATTVMTVMMLIAPMMGMPDMKIGNMVANFMHIPIALGWVIHFMIGIFWAGIYAFFFKDLVSINPSVKGILFALIPWLLMQVLIMPMMGMGVFSSLTPEPIKMLIGTMMGHLIYGLILGLTIKGKM